MSERFLDYLRREHARLQQLIDRERRRPVQDELQLARLNRLDRAVRDQLTELEAAAREARAA